jgi:hypothetical protein
MILKQFLGNKKLPGEGVIYLVVLTGESSNSLWELLDRLGSVPVAPAGVEPWRAPARHFRFSSAQTIAVIEAYEGGASMAELARMYGVRRVSISALLRREGVSIRVRRVMSQGEVDRAVQLYVGGLSLQKIGDQLGWDHKTIYGQLRKRGVVMRGANDWQHPDA